MTDKMHLPRLFADEVSGLALRTVRSGAVSPAPAMRLSRRDLEAAMVVAVQKSKPGGSFFDDMLAALRHVGVEITP